MGEAAPHLEPPIAGGDNPELRVCASTPEQLEFEASAQASNSETEQPDKWPNIELELSEQNLFGGNLPTNSEARVLTVVNSLKAIAPTSLPTLDRPYADYRKEQRNFLLHKVRIKGEEFPRAVFVGRNKIFDDLWDQLKEVNHPVVQAFQKVEQIYKQRLERNKLLPEANKLRLVSDLEMERLREDLLLTSHGDVIRQRVIQRIGELRNAK